MITTISQFATSLIEVGYSTKLFNIKGKGTNLDLNNLYLFMLIKILVSCLDSSYGYGTLMS